MSRSSSALAEILTGKSPAVMYDALWAEYLLSQRGLDAPSEVLDLIRAIVGRRQRAVLDPALLLQIADALAESDLLNEAGKRLAARPAGEARLALTEERPMTKEEYLHRLRIKCEQFPAVDGCASPPREWLRDAWDVREVREMMVDNGMAEGVVRHGRIFDEAIPFLREMASILRTDQVVRDFLLLREVAPHKERTFRPQFEQVFAQHAHALPAWLARREVLDFLRLDEREGQWFCEGKPVTRGQLIAWFFLDDEGARWLLGGAGDP